MPHEIAIDDHIAALPAWSAAILDHLRALVHQGAPDVTEAIKWGRPFFLIDGRPFAMMAAFKAHCVFGFWKQGQPAKETEGGGQYGRIASLADLPADDVLLAEIRAAVAMARLHPAVRIRAARAEPDPPPELAAALAASAAAADAFAGFPPSCRREYIEWIVAAKRPETRARRIAQTIAQCADGKRLNARYEKS